MERKINEFKERDNVRKEINLPLFEKANRITTVNYLK